MFPSCLRQTLYYSSAIHLRIRICLQTWSFYMLLTVRQETEAMSIPQLHRTASCKNFKVRTHVL